MPFQKPQVLILFSLFPMLAAAAPVRIVADDAGLQAPARISSGMRHILFENHGKEIHEAMFVKLPKGMTAADYLARVKAGELFPKGALDYSGAGLTSPGEGTEVWVQLEAGEYVLICWHHPRVSVRALHVEATGEADDTPPKEDVTLKLVDFRFELGGPIRKGLRVIRIETPGPSMHEADFFRLLPGHDAADVKRWYAKDDLEGAPPAVALGGILDSHDTRRTVWLRKSFIPGRYVIHCAMPMTSDAKSGEHYATHADAGMVTTFEVAE
ncbi:MAG TPA: hypothetical protein VFS13_20475 [Steroidobacteraceae bacterium]|nr:hypothetical protein [Steroidobacteraceae bacterium]